MEGALDLSNADLIIRVKDTLRELQNQHVGFEILRDHILDVIHQLLKRQETIHDSAPFLLKTLVEGMSTKKVMPRDIF